KVEKSYESCSESYESYSYCYSVYSRCIAQLREKSLTDRFENRRLLVNSQLKILFNLQAISQESGVALKELQATIQSCLTALAMSAINVEAWDCLLMFMISSKLPKVTLSMWEQSVHNKAEIPTWKELDNFLTERHRTLEAIDDVRPSGSGQLPPRSGTPTAPARCITGCITRCIAQSLESRCTRGTQSY
ncbi:hypothetical protein KR074_008458, partial [Drosophila pseudoananassae]